MDEQPNLNEKAAKPSKPSKRLKWEVRGAFMRRLMDAKDPESLALSLARARAHRARMRRAKPERMHPATRRAAAHVDFSGDGSASAELSEWESLGPDNVPGRITSLAVHPVDGDVVYAGSADGGVFKTENAGHTWRALWHDQDCLAIGAVAIAPSAPEVVYASTGEWGIQEAMGVLTLPGVGVYRSPDAGSTWNLQSPIASRYTSAIAVDSSDPNRLYVAGNRALHRTRDGGATWDVTGTSLYGGANALGVFDATISDVAIHPDTGDLWIGVHFNGVWRSADGGDSFVQLTTMSHGLPEGVLAPAPRFAFGPPSSPGRRVAVKVKSRVFLARTGAFVPSTPFNDLAPLPEYTNTVAIDPTDEDNIIGGNAIQVRSTDGGSTWDIGDAGVGSADPPVHLDKQAIIFDPTHPGRVYQATDGGVYVSMDHGRAWTLRSSGLATTQCYSVGVSLHGSLAYGITTQDNWSYRWSTGRDFVMLVGAEGGWVDYDWRNSDQIYVDTWFPPLSVQRSIDKGVTWTNLGIDTIDLAHHFFSRGFAVCDDSKQMLALRRSGPDTFVVPVAHTSDGGRTWTDTLSEPNLTITAIAYARATVRVAYAASVDGRLWQSLDSGETWTELTAGGPLAWVQAIEVDWQDPSRLYVVYGVSGVRQAWRVVVNGAVAEWTDISGATPETSLPDLAVTAMVVHPEAPDVLFVSNSIGVFRTDDGGNAWMPFDHGLPNALVSDLRVRVPDLTLYAATWGRGAFRRRI